MLAMTQLPQMGQALQPSTLGSLAGRAGCDLSWPPSLLPSPEMEALGPLHQEVSCSLSCDMSPLLPLSCSHPHHFLRDLSAHLPHRRSIQ